MLLFLRRTRGPTKRSTTGKWTVEEVNANSSRLGMLSNLLVLFLSYKHRPFIFMIWCVGEVYHISFSFIFDMSLGSIPFLSST